MEALRFGVKRGYGRRKPWPITRHFSSQDRGTRDIYQYIRAASNINKCSASLADGEIVLIQALRACGRLPYGDVNSRMRVWEIERRYEKRNGDVRDGMKA